MAAAAAAVAVAVEVPDARKLPPGFRFHPSDEEIVAHYLKNKVSGKKPDIEVIREIDLYKSEPWDLPEKSILNTRDPEWYFFCPRDKKYPNGSRSNRATEKGYWKATGKDRKVKSRLNKIGMKKTLVFHEGRAPRGQRTDWLMHEYRLDETECNGSPHLQELYVVCRVFKKGKQGSNNGEQGTSDDFDLSPSKSNLSPTKVNSVGEIEELSEERLSPLMQEDDTQTTSGLRSEASSEIIDIKNENNTCFEGSMESFQGRSNPDYSYSSHDETTANENADIALGTQEGQTETPNQMWDLGDLPPHPYVLYDYDYDFPFEGVSDAYYRDGSSPVAQASEEDDLGRSILVDGVGDTFGGGYIKELDDFLQSSNEPNNDEPCFEDVNDCIQFRTRSSPLQSYQQPLPSQGTASRRLRLQIYKPVESAEGNKQHGLTGDCQSEWHDCNTDDSETVTQMEGSALVSLPRKTNSLEEDDADSGFVYDPSEPSERITSDHTLTVGPVQTLASGLSNGASLERSENSLNATGSEENHILSGTLDSLKSSSYGQSSCVDGPLIENIQDNNERPQQHFNKSVGKGTSISVIRGQTLIAKSEHIAKCELTVSESNSEIHNQGPELGDSSPKGWKMVSHGNSSTELQPESEVSSTSTKELKLVKEGMKYSATSFMKGYLASDGITSFSSHGTGIEETGISCERRVKLRGKPRIKDVAKSFSYHCSKEGANGSVNLRKARGILKWFSKLQSKLSNGSSSISLLMGLLGTAVLVFFIRVIWQLARSSPPIIF